RMPRPERHADEAPGLEAQVCGRAVTVGGVDRDRNEHVDHAHGKREEAIFGCDAVGRHASGVARRSRRGIRDGQRETVQFARRGAKQSTKGRRSQNAEISQSRSRPRRQGCREVGPHRNRRPPGRSWLWLTARQTGRCREAQSAGCDSKRCRVGSVWMDSREDSDGGVELSDDALTAALRAYPGLRKRVSSIVLAVEGAEGELTEADAAEERLVEEMRLLGREALLSWAEKRVEATEREIRQRPQ